jgi:hypothetical protein
MFAKLGRLAAPTDLKGCGVATAPPQPVTHRVADPYQAQNEDSHTSRSLANRYDDQMMVLTNGFGIDQS